MSDAKKPKQQTVETVVATGEGVKIVPEKHGRHHGVTVLLEPDDLVREQATGFANFLRDYAVVGLAIGFIIGQEANTVVKQLVASFIAPWLQVLFGPKLSTRFAVVHHGQTPVDVPWGAFVYSMIEFVFVVIGVYIAIKLFRLDKLRKKK